MNFFGLNKIGNENSIKINKEIHLYIHDELHIVKATDYSPSTTLNDYLRKVSYLTGTKVMCREAGCGCCIVAAIAKHPVTAKDHMFTVNSCLVSIFSCDSWRIVTIEGLRSPQTGLDKIQDTLIKYNGSQCGFCTSGMIMTMYYLTKSKSNVTKAEVDNSFGGNLCRCTGYRPILEAFKSLTPATSVATNAPEMNDTPDIEDIPSCPLKDELKDFTHLFRVNTKPFGLELKEGNWYKVFTINEIFEVLTKYPTLSYRLVAGNTAHGVYKTNTERDLYIDISNVKELQEYSVTLTNLKLGGNMTLNDTMDVFRQISKSYTVFSYLRKLADHIDLIATVPVRNIGTLAGNLSIKHEHNEFPSDIFLMFETIGATVTIASKIATQTVSLSQYLKTDMKNKVIKSISLPALDTTYLFNTYKIMPRAQNAHAMVNAGFLVKVDANSVVTKATVVYGGINPTFIHAQQLETVLQGKKLFDNATLQLCFKTLDGELKPDYVLPDPKPAYRKGLAIALFYKFVLYSASAYKLSPRNVSGGQILVRDVSVGTQDIETSKDLYPVGEPIPKLEAYAQVTGDAKYVIDHPDQPGQLYAALVLGKAPAYTTIGAISTSKAMAVKGVVAFYSAKDIPGANSFTAMLAIQEKIFADKTLDYYNQPVGVIVANSQEIAEKAASLVEVVYIRSLKKPLLTIQDLLANNATDKIVPDTNIERKCLGTDIKRTLEGTFYAHLQYHFHMENQSCNVIPTEDGLDVFATTQWMDIVQTSIAASTKLSANKVNVYVRRLGGAYGGKITRNGMPSCQAALAAHILKRPVRIWLPLETNMTTIGKRCPVYAKYKVGFDDKGVIQSLDVSLYMDYSTGGNEIQIKLLMPMLYNGYKRDTFQIITYHTNTDTPGNIYCRAPGTCQGFALIESIMEEISYTLNLNPLDVRMANWDNTNHPKLPVFLKSFLTEANIDNRKKEITQFNTENRWRKKGLSVVTMAYLYEVFGNWNVYISVYHTDGSVSVTHGGIEMGQGINTKVAQTCAYSLGIPLESIQVKPSNSIVSPNIVTSGGSATSESVCYAVIQAAELLKKAMEPVRQKMKNPTWLQVVHQCYNENVPLISQYSFKPTDRPNYMIYGLCAAEVEVDILTGNHLIKRVDILEDVGDSLSPLVDLGQVEGAFIMGVGYWSLENIIMSPDGEIKTDRTWTYKVPGAKDIPVDFRVKFPKNNPNALGVLKSKATGEPAVCMSCAVPFAIRRALSSAREDADPKASKWFGIDGPTTVEETFLNSLNDYKQYVL